MCARDSSVTYLLGDMDLLSLEESANQIYTSDEWEKMAGHDPAGTMGMEPPEVGITWYFGLKSLCENNFPGN